MTHPKILILFTAYNEYPDGHSRYGMLAPDRRFFQLLQEHLDATLTFFRTVPKAMELQEDRSVEFRYRELSTEHGTGNLDFISRSNEIRDGSDDNIEDLLNVCAQDLLRPDVLPTATLEEAEHPVIIDFEAWHSALFDSAYYEGTVDEFWQALQSNCANLRGERLVIKMPLGTYGKDVKLEALPTFLFTARDKHSDSDTDWASMPFPMKKFIQGIGDVVLSRLG